MLPASRTAACSCNGRIRSDIRGGELLSTQRGLSYAQESGENRTRGLDRFRRADRPLGPAGVSQDGDHHRRWRILRTIQVEDRAGQSRHGLPDRTAVRCDDAVALVRFTRGAVQRIGWIARWRVGSPLVPTHPHRVRDRRLARAVRGNRHRRSNVDSDGSPDSLTRVDIVQWSRCRGWRSRPCLEAEGVAKRSSGATSISVHDLLQHFAGRFPPPALGAGLSARRRPTSAASTGRASRVPGRPLRGLQAVEEKDRVPQGRSAGPTGP